MLSDLFEFSKEFLSKQLQFHNQIFIKKKKTEKKGKMIPYREQDLQSQGYSYDCSRGLRGCS